MDNLLKVRFIREIKYPEWLANVVVVQKKGGKWRVRVDYTDLKEACLKDNFPLPRIDQIVNASARHGMLLFLDAFSGISSNTHASARRGKNSLHHPARAVLLKCDIVWLKE